VVLQDNKRDRIAEVLLKEGGLQCLLDEKSDCIHVGFVYSLPELYNMSDEIKVPPSSAYGGNFIASLISTNQRNSIRYKVVIVLLSFTVLTGVSEQLLCYSFSRLNAFIAGIISSMCVIAPCCKYWQIILILHQTFG
jgi:hypothetical protein